MYGDISLLDTPILVRKLLLCVPKVNCRKTDNLKAEPAEICNEELHYPRSTICNYNISALFPVGFSVRYFKEAVYFGSNFIFLRPRMKCLRMGHLNEPVTLMLFWM